MKLTQTHAEILKFIIVGGINTLNYYVVYLLLLKLLHIEYMISHITGFLVAFVISYYLNCYFVYRVKPTWRKFISFPITQIVNVSLQTVLLYVFVSWLNLPAEIAPFAGLIITIPITFILSKWILKIAIKVA
ncbi:Putative sugar translocase in surface polysaccharides biosynthesis [Staphylococcus aureus]|uniref:Sugar translocase in surface polysaccharides biosynthesis n=4 Tax=Staphylococcus TaxID=1279 RepID=A0A380EP86_STAAU|nr:Putative sugar translocase in surface polysaccharides biosynthesis [Staphylococcus aureus]